MVLSPITSGLLKALKGEVMTLGNPPTESGRSFPNRLQQDSYVYGRPISRPPAISCHSNCFIRKPINTCRKLQPGRPGKRKVESTAERMGTFLSRSFCIGLNLFHAGARDDFGSKLSISGNIGGDVIWVKLSTNRHFVNIH